MGTEIERKFLVKSDDWRQASIASADLRQGYLAADRGNTVRIRTDGVRGWLTIKGPSEGCARSEFEYGVPLDDAVALLGLCGDLVVEKRRSRVVVGRHTWEVDEFSGRNAGLVLAEVELTREDEAVQVPAWIGSEVTGDRRFDNASLSARPWTEWTAAERAQAGI